MGTMATNGDILDKLVQIFNRLSPGDESLVDELGALYAEDMVFQDPIQTIHGREAFLEMNRRLIRRCKELRAQVEARASSGEHLFLKFQFELKPPLGTHLRIAGVTHLRVHEGLIVDHRDYWDLLGSVMESMPLVAPVYRAIVSKLG